MKSLILRFTQSCSRAVVCGCLKLMLAALIMSTPFLAKAQTLVVTNGIQTYPGLTNTTITMTGQSELHITGTNNPLSGCVINLNSSDAWLFRPAVRPSAVSASYLSKIFVNGSQAVIGGNVRVSEFVMGSV